MAHDLLHEVSILDVHDWFQVNTLANRQDTRTCKVKTSQNGPFLDAISNEDIVRMGKVSGP